MKGTLAESVLKNSNDSLFVCWLNEKIFAEHKIGTTKGTRTNMPLILSATLKATTVLHIALKAAIHSF